MRYLVDGRDGKAFDLVTRPVKQMAMNLPPFNEELALLTLQPDGVEGSGALPDSLVKLAPLIQDLPPTSQNLVMEMRRDDEGMGLLDTAGLMKMNRTGTFDPAVAKAVTKLIVEGPALPLDEQLSANAINGEAFKLGRVPFGVAVHKDLRWLISEGTDRMLHPVPHPWLSVPHPCSRWKGSAGPYGGLEGYGTDFGGRDLRSSNPFRPSGTGACTLYGPLSQSRARRLRHDDQLHGLMRGKGRSPGGRCAAGGCAQTPARTL